MHSESDDVFERHLKSLKEQLTEQLNAAGIRQAIDEDSGFTQELNENQQKLFEICRDFYNQTKVSITGETVPFLETSDLAPSSSYTFITDYLDGSQTRTQIQTLGLSDVLKTFESELQEKFPHKVQVLENLSKYGGMPSNFVFFKDLLFPQMQDTVDKLSQMMSKSNETSWTAGITKDIQLYQQLLQAIKSSDSDLAQIKYIFAENPTKFLDLIKSKGYLALDYALETKSSDLILFLIQISGDQKENWLQILFDKNKAKPRIDQGILENIAFMNDTKTLKFYDYDFFSPNHSYLIICGKQLGYPLSEEGICQGFTMRWIEATISNHQTRFLNRIFIIHKLNRLLNEGHTLDQLERPEWKEILWEIKAFYESLYLYQEEHISSSILKMRINQTDIDEISEIAASDEIRKEQIGGIKSSAILRYDEFNQHGLLSTLMQLEEKIEACEYDEPICFLLTCLGDKGIHAINVTYYPRTKTWQWMDINYPIQAPKKLNELTNFTGIPAPLYFQQYDTFCISAILPKKCAESVEPFLTQMIKYPSKEDSRMNQHILFQASYEGDVEVVEALLNERTELSESIFALYIAAQKGHLEVVKTLLDGGVNYNQAMINGETPLCIAAKKGHLEVVEALLEYGAKPNKPMTNGVTPLYIAAEKGHLEVVKTLLDSGADYNKPMTNGATPLYIAAEKGHLEVVKTLLDSRADYNKPMANGATPLYIAAEKGHTEIVKALLARGSAPNLAKADRTTALFIAAQKGHLDVVDLLLQYQAKPNKAITDGATPLLIAAKNGHLKIVEALLRYGADRNLAMINGTTPLYIAAQNGHLDVVDALLRYQAKPNKAMKNGNTPLYIAARNGHLEIVKSLLENSADRNLAISNRETPLFVAAEKGRMNIVDVLLRYRANPNIATSNGATPLYIAAQNGHLDIVKALLARGANPNIATSNGETPLLVASRNGHLEIADALRLHLHPEHSDVGPTIR